jgi:hypothetical protein
MLRNFIFLKYCNNILNNPDFTVVKALLATPSDELPNFSTEAFPNLPSGLIYVISTINSCALSLR